MVQREVLEVLADIEYCHARLNDLSTSLLLRYEFGNEVGLTHQLLIDRNGATIELTTAHQFNVSVGPNFAESNEIAIRATLSISASDCAVRVVIQAYLDQATGGFPAGPSVLREQHHTGLTLSEAVRLLRAGVDEVYALDDPLGPLVRQSGR